MHSLQLTIVIFILQRLSVHGINQVEIDNPSINGKQNENRIFVKRSLNDETTTNLLIMPYINPTTPIIGTVGIANSLPTFEPQPTAVPIAIEPFTLTLDSALTTNNPQFARPNGNPNGDYYYNIFELIPSQTATYQLKSISEIDAYGLLYSNSFDDTQPTTNLLTVSDDDAGDAQFLIWYTLEENVRYYLVATTYGVGVTDNVYQVYVEGPYDITVTRITALTESMPNATITSSLYYYNSVFGGVDDISNNIYYYDIVRVTVPITGNYTFQSVARIDLYGLIYYPTFDPTSPITNRLAIAGALNNYGRFRILYTLESDREYLLVVTSVSPLTVGDYSITLKGPEIPTLTIITNTTSSSRGINGILRRTRRFIRFGALYASYFYNVYEIKIRRSGYYTLESNSTVDLMGFLYTDNFIASAAAIDLWTFDDDSAANQQFRIREFFSSLRKYYLIVTTKARRITGHYRIIATGPINALFIPVPSSSNGTATVSSEWTNTTQKFRRPNGFGRNHYYQLFRVLVHETGLYSIIAGSMVDSVGYIYTPTFNASEPTDNLLTEDDQSGGQDQFGLTLILKTNVTYYLVATTYREFRYGTFNVTMTGPGQPTITFISSKKR